MAKVEKVTSFSVRIHQTFRDVFQDFTTDDYGNLTWCVFVIETIFIGVVMLNMLVAIMTETFSRVLQNAVAADLKERASLIQDVEELMTWNYHVGERKFLHIVREKVAIGGGQWDGQMREIAAGITEVGKGVVTMLDYSRKSEDYLANEVKKSEKSYKAMVAKQDDRIHSLLNDIDYKISHSAGECVKKTMESSVRHV